MTMFLILVVGVFVILTVGVVLVGVHNANKDDNELDRDLEGTEAEEEDELDCDGGCGLH